MMRTNLIGTLLAASILAATAAACSSSTASPASTGDAGGATDAGDSQTPPIGASAITAWLASGVYKSWHCESAVHDARSPSPHNVDRVCSNDVIASGATGAGPWPAGAAAVKELYASTTDATPGGYAVYLKTQATSANGANWYYYGALTAGGTVVDGMGSDATVMAQCTSCHLAAGSDAAHTPSPGGRDEVYTPVH
jgi:hypothetical protein